MPQQHTNDDKLALAKIVEEIESRPGQSVALLQNLTKNDYAIIGQFIQLYCYADLNIRRIMKAASTVDATQKAPKVRDSEALEFLRQLPDNFHIPHETRVGILATANTLILNNSIRHSFAHWAIKRVRGKDAFAVFSANEVEAKHRSGEPLPSGHIKFGIVAIRHITEQLRILKGNDIFLARFATKIEAAPNSYPKIKR
jgi:hypothetical protein